MVSKGALGKNKESESRAQGGNLSRNVGVQGLRHSPCRWCGEGRLVARGPWLRGVPGRDAWWHAGRGSAVSPGGASGGTWAVAPRCPWMSFPHATPAVLSSLSRPVPALGTGLLSACPARPQPPLGPLPILRLPQAPPRVCSFLRRSWWHVPVGVAPPRFSLGTKRVR